MTRLAVVMLVAVLGALPVSAHAAPAAKKKAAPAKHAKPLGPAPMASAEEINKLKGDFKWGMTVDEVAAQVTKRVEAAFEERLQKASNDPTRYDRLRKELQGEIGNVKKNYVKFDGQKTGYDVSIVDQEFAQKTSESLLVAKENTSTRYFFFSYEKLYKMFVAFDKEMLQGKSFEDFGKMMQGRYGTAQQVFVQQPVRGGVKRVLDHYLWSSKTGDVLRLVDRSEFYDVYCLVVYDGRVNEQQVAARKAANPEGEKKDGLVEAVTLGTGGNDRDSNDNVMDRITGKTVYKPGEGPAAGNITVQVPTDGTRGPTPAEINERGNKPAAETGSGSKKAKGESSRPAAAKGLEL